MKLDDLRKMKDLKVDDMDADTRAVLEHVLGCLQGGNVEISEELSESARRTMRKAGTAAQVGWTIIRAIGDVRLAQLHSRLALVQARVTVLAAQKAVAERGNTPLQ